MMKAFLVVGASVAFAQQCYMNDASNCSTTPNCTWIPGQCYRKNLMSPCGGGGMCNTTDGCAMGSMVTNPQTCSMCGDSCMGMPNTTCTGDAACGWLNGQCINTPAQMMDPCNAGMASKTACTGMAGCFWLSIQEWTCGQMSTVNQCISCSAIDVNVRSAITNYKGQTCTWAAMNMYNQSFKATMMDAGQSATGNCSALNAPSAMDMTVLTSPQVRPFFMNAYAPAASPNCMMSPTAAPGKNSAASLVPGVAFLVAVALM